MSKLRTTFGNLYHPRRIPYTKSLKHRASLKDVWANGARNPAAEGEHASKVHNGQKAMINSGSLVPVFSLPMQAPSPWVNPAYYTGQVPASNQLPTPTLALPTHTTSLQQPLPFYQFPPCFAYPQAEVLPCSNQWQEINLS